jgi:CRP-like cAMP-binding protein
MTKAAALRLFLFSAFSGTAAYGQERSASVRAAAPTEVAVLGRQNFLTMLRTIPSTREDVMKTFQERAAKSFSSV